jgi:hypothetical protein
MSQGGYRVVHVDAKSHNHGKLMVRTKAGYYPKQASGQQKAAVSQPNQPQ